MVIIPIFFSRLAEINSAYWIFVRQKKKPTHNNEADEQSKENESCLAW